MILTGLPAPTTVKKVYVPSVRWKETLERPATDPTRSTRRLHDKQHAISSCSGGAGAICLALLHGEVDSQSGFHFKGSLPHGG